MIEALRRRNMMADKGGGGGDTENLYNFAKLYPKSSYSLKDDKINLLEELTNNYAEYMLGIKFQDSDEDIVIKYRSGTFPCKEATSIYLLDYQIVRNKYTGYVESVTLPASAKNRIIFLSSSGGYGYDTGGGIQDCVAINANMDYVFIHPIRFDSRQIYINKNVDTLLWSIYNYRPSEPQFDYGGEIDTCSLIIPTVAEGSYISRFTMWYNWQNLESIIVRKVTGLPCVFMAGWLSYKYATPFRLCTNIKKVTFEWDTPEEIPTYNSEMSIPLTATLYIPKGTIQMYVDKGWNMAEIIEY